MSNNTDDLEADERANNCAQGWVTYVRAEYPLKLRIRTIIANKIDTAPRPPEETWSQFMETLNEK